MLARSARRPIVLALAFLAIAWAEAARGQAPTTSSWATRCADRLERARQELARSVPWAARGRVTITPLSAPMRGSMVDYAHEGRRSVDAMIEDYPGTRAGAPWTEAGRGECFDERMPPPQLHAVRNYDGRQAQVRIDGAPRRDRALVWTTLSTALDECATY